MNILIDSHTLERAEERGTNETEIKDVINTGFPIAAKYNRLEKAKVYPFQNHRTKGISMKKRGLKYFLL